MSNSYRIRTQVGVDKSVNIQLEQDFEFLEILSLKLLQSQVYQRRCSDYGVIVGRVTANNGFGIPNAKVSVFVPLTDQDSQNPIISELYPYRTINDVNEDGYRYNLLPYIQSHSGHVPVGTFFSKEDVLTNPNYIEVFDKYYKYTSLTNESGDFMIFGVPVGDQTIHVDIDLSDIGEFSLSPQDLIRMGIATEAQVAGNKFRQSTNLNELVQLIKYDSNVYVAPLWGEPEVCQLAITRLDFDLTSQSNISITPTAIFMGSIFSSTDDQFQRRNCKPKTRQGELCNLVAGPGQILAIRQTSVLDELGRPILEVFDLEQGGQVIDDNGTWLVDLPMNLDFVTTNEFGERIISDDPNIGIPTTAKYRFKIKWNQSPKLSEPIKRGYFLVPNVREYGWAQSGNVDPLTDSATPTNTELAYKSYAFSLDWEDYADIQAAMDCEDTFYPFVFNKVYTISQLIDQYRNGFLPNRIITIKNILDESCESENVKFPTNDVVYRFDLIYLFFVIAIFIFRPILYLALLVAHFVAYILQFIGNRNWRRVAYIQVPNLTYPECDLCECKQGRFYTGVGPSEFELEVSTTLSENAYIYPLNQFTNYTECSSMSGVRSLYTGNQFLPTFGGPTPTYINPESMVGPPQLESYTVNPDRIRDVFTTSLPLWEKINLFNTKAKYFDDGFNNPGGSWNRIGVTFRPSLNGSSSGALGSSAQFSQQYLNVVVSTNNINYTNPSSNTLNPIPFINQTVQPTIGINPFNAVTGEYTALFSGTYSFVLDFNLTFNNPNITYSFLVYKNNIQLNNGGGLSWQNSNITTWRHTFGPILNAGDTIKIVGQNYSNQPYDFDCQLTMSVTGTRTNPYHLDNCLTMVVKADKLSSLRAGTILSFQNPDLTKDINLTGATLNSFETNSITGTSINNGTVNNPSIINVNWAKPDGTGTNTTSYFISQTESDAQYAKYAMDIEYFQVITAMTIGQYLQLCKPIPSSNQTSFLDNYAASFRYRFLFGKMIYNRVRVLNHQFEGPVTTDELIKCIEDWEKQLIVFMNRGVDPYSSRGEVEYDLSRLFGYDLLPNGSPQGEVLVRGNKYKLNIPIQGHYACARHSELVSDVTLNDSLMNEGHIYYPSYHFLPSTTQFSAFTSDLPNYYLSLSRDYTTSPLNSYLSPAPSVDNPCQIGAFQANVSQPPQYQYIKLRDRNNTGQINRVCNYDNFGNGFLFTWNRRLSNCSPQKYGHNINNSTTNYERNGGYYINEVVDGGSVMYSLISFARNNAGTGNPPWGLGADAYYYSPRYSGLSFNYINNANNGRIVMRSDRLPTSTNVRDVGENSFALQGNELFTFYEIFDDGTFIASGGELVGNPTFDIPNTSVDTFGTGSTLLDTFTCDSMVPLGCYYVPTINGVPSNEIAVQPTGNSCYQNGYNREEIMEDGCYVFITAPFDSLGRDIVLLTEWTSRIQITFAACRNVWSHIFTNNWINGSLYAFSFKNDRVFSSPNSQPPATANQPSSLYCKDTIVLHPTNNFYYRSSPYNSGTTLNRVGRFVGSDKPSTSSFSSFFGFTDYGGNRRNLKYPTTILDLGPRSQYIQELVFSDTYDGFVMDRMVDTSFKDVSEILNLLIVSRLSNKTYLDRFSVGRGVNISTFFGERNKNFGDGDYAQLISISSELAINEFESINYQSIDNEQDPIFFNSSLSTDPVIGIYYSSDTQTRDFITPKRTIINPILSVGTQCAFNYYDNFSQYVPFYQWEIKENDDSQYDSIFGSRKNDWYTLRLTLTGLTPTQDPNSSVFTFFYHRYQSLDRLNSLSRYFRTKPSPYSKDYVGYIYSVDYTQVGTSQLPSTGPSDFEYETQWITPNPPNQQPDRVFTVGAPYHFYFGLKKGKTAWDRFAKKWLDLETFTD